GCGGLCTRVGIAKKLPPQARRGGSAANKKLRSHLSPRRRVVKRTILLISTTPAAATASASPPRLRRGVWWLLLRDSHRLLALRCIGLARLRKCCIVVVNEPLQYGMSGEAFEMVLLHFLIRAVSTPAVQSHSVHRCHYARAMAAPLAVHKHWPIGGVVHQLEKLRHAGVGRPVRRR